MGDVDDAPVGELGVDERDTYERLWAHVQPPKAREILIGALAAFARRGFHAATTRDIAELAGLSPAGVYVHYRSKVDVLFELIRTGHEVMLARVEAAVADGPQDPTACVRRFAVAWAQGHAQLHTLARVSQHELPALPPERRREVRRLRARLVHGLTHQVQRGVADGSFDTEDVAGSVRAVMSLGTDVARWYGLERGPSPEAIGAQYGELTVRMLAAR